MRWHESPERPSFQWSALSLQMPPGTTMTRSSTANYFDKAGVLQQAAVDVPRFQYTAGNLDGYIVEQSITNTALRCRDFTNAAWVKTTMTAALDQTGIDGTASSASSLLATAGNATVLQTVTSASAQRTLSFYLKRITGSGTINITQDGTTWTAVAALSSTDWTRVTLTNTQTNPVFGIQIVTNTDKIAVDFAQLEALEIATTPIATAGTGVQRQADVAGFNIAQWLNPAAGCIYLSFIPNGVSALSTLRNLLSTSDGTTANRVSLSITAGSAAVRGIVTTASSALISASATTVDVVAGAPSYALLSWCVGTIPFLVVNNGVLRAGSASGASPIGLTTMYLGIADNGGSSTAGFISIREIAIFPYQLSVAQASKLTAPR